MTHESDKHLHIISFDIPYPVDYGGVIDVYYKIKALKSEGIKVHLHCFEYGRKHTESLNNICHTVHYYPRKKGLKHLLSQLPYIVSTRVCKDLLEELEKDNYPILYEGLHSTAILHYKDMSKRKNIVRMHNIEHDYYYQLSQATSNFLKKWFYKAEAVKLKKYETILNKADYILAISHSDFQALSNQFNNVIHISAFHSNDSIQSKTGKGSYLLYHGNLSVEENEKAALFLINNVFRKIEVPCVISGKNPTKLLKKMASKYKNIEIVANPDKYTMKELIQEAHINILPTFQATGIKLKLLESLAIGRFCLVNSPMVENTGLETMTIIRDQASDIIHEINHLMNINFAQDEIVKREKIWAESFSNQVTIKKLTTLL